MIYSFFERNSRPTDETDVSQYFYLEVLHMKTKHVQLKINPQEHIIVQLEEPILFDKLHTLSAEYSVSMDLLVSLAIKRLIDDIDLIRNLRTGKIKGV